MTLHQATYFTASLLVAFGLPLLLNPVATQQLANRLPRSKITAGITMVLGTAWFIMRHVSNLSESDFGSYKSLIILVSLVILVSSFLYLPDFLAVRGAAILTLLFAREALDAAYLQVPVSRLFMVSFIYLAIIAALYLSAWPYRLRDFFDWLFGARSRTRILGGIMATYGILLFVLAFTY